MLTSLIIKNFALIDHLQIAFDHGLNVVTGETGAGKSIVIDALSLALGERADTSAIREGTEKAIVEAEFDVENLGHLQPLVMKLGADWQPVLILRREVSSKGVSRCFINDVPVNVAALKEIGDALVDIHGQHEHQSLLHRETHIDILDRMGNLGPLVEEYRFRYQALKEIQDELRDAMTKRDTIEQRKIELDRILHELHTINPQPNEDEKIESELKRAEHAERIVTAGNEILTILYDGEGNAADSLGRAMKLLQELSQIDDSLRVHSNELSSAAAIVTETAFTVRTYLEKLDVEPERCEELRHRLNELQNLKRRYRMTLDELLQSIRQMEAERDSLDNLDAHIDELNTKLEKTRAFVSAQAVKLTQARKKASAHLATAIVSELKELGISHARFETIIERRPADDARDGLFVLYDNTPVLAGANGADDVEFFLSTNVGEEPKPLAKVASGGEVSRIMLAMKSVFSDSSAVPVLVFDEIDVGVSGNIASKVGQSMHRLAKHHQVIAITHLPQIAGAGDVHFLVSKTVEGKRTRTNVQRLEMEERTREIARLVSGDQITEASIQNALELINNR